MKAIKLLSVGKDSKTTKGEGLGYLTGILYLAPHKLSGMNVCSYASEGCKAACLYTAGRAGSFAAINQARLRRTVFFRTSPRAFIAQLSKEIDALVRRAHKVNLVPVVRLNGTSDLPWESLGILANHPGVQFYDYTKNPIRMARFLRGELPSNYHLTFSRSECNQDDTLRVLSSGGNATVVFKGALPESYCGFRVVNGDASDLRFLDPKGVVVGLKAKGKARKDTSGFVV